MAACCPPDSLGRAPYNTLQPKGSVVTLDGTTERKPMPCYQIGPDQPERILLVFPDVFGLDSGLHKVVCDVLQEKLGDKTAVWMPDLYRGRPILGAWGLGDFITFGCGIPSILWASCTHMKLTSLEKDLKTIVQPALKSVEKIACLGFCYGGWVVGRCLALEGFPAKAGIGVHPSFKLQTIFGLKEEALAEDIGEKPLLFLPAKNDDLKVGSPVVKILARNRGVEEAVVAIEFEEMLHGWVPRGDSNDPKVKEAQEKAMALAADFVEEHVKL